MRNLLFAALLSSCANPQQPAPVGPEPVDPAQVAARAGFLLEQVAKADSRERVCRADVGARDAEIASLQAQVATLAAAVVAGAEETARVQGELSAANDLARARARQVVGAFVGCRADTDLAQRATAERDACYLQLASHGAVSSTR